MNLDCGFRDAQKKYSPFYSSSFDNVSLWEKCFWASVHHGISTQVWPLGEIASLPSADPVCLVCFCSVLLTNVKLWIDAFCPITNQKCCYVFLLNAFSVMLLCCHGIVIVTVSLSLVLLQCLRQFFQSKIESGQ